MTDLGLIDSALLVAIANGVNSLKSLCHVLSGFSEDVVRRHLESLESKGLVKRRVKGLIFKREVYELTEEGSRMLEEAYSKLREAAEKLKRVAERADHEREGPEALKRALREAGLGLDVLPLVQLMALLGLLDVFLLPLFLDFFDPSMLGGYEHWV